MSLAPVTVALDWAPNVNHIGFYVAEARGDFAAAGVTVTLLPYADGGPKPAARLVDGSADLAFAPSESIVSYARPRPGTALKPELVAVAAAAATDTSAIVALAGRDITRPRDLDGKTYVSYGARYEDEIVRCMVRADGGTGNFNIAKPPFSTIPPAVFRGEAGFDATWVFMPHEGVAAARAGVSLVAWRPEDYGVPYGYTPVLLARRWAAGTPPPEALRAVLSAAAKGYEFVARAPAAEVASLVSMTALGRASESLEILTESITALAPALLDPAPGSVWGTMQHGKWTDFLAFLEARGLVEEGASSADAVARLFTNEALPAKSV